MPKLKTKKAISKRFRVTKNKKIMANRANRRHMMADKTPKKRRQLRRKLSADVSANLLNMRKAMPYGN
ncbi:MAG TPA: 50S ribosomal protein L35 [Candidatus Omnitrophota bacterium]|nr:50S ribosomal protein L35 [Candidatus Omnitrophota bacterium]